MSLAYYLHDFSPYLVKFTDRLQIHWYGLAYVLGFYGAYLIMHRLAVRGYSELKPDKVADFITYTALFGVVLGGRLGYMLFYNFDAFIHNPATFFRLWDGGMASHGGILGIILFTLFYAWKNKISWPGLGDNLVVGAPIGLFFGRLANFVNGELYGRVTDVSWAVKFPSEIHDPHFTPVVAPADFALQALPQHSSDIIESVSQIPGGLEQLVAALHPRHPSQLYEAALEGLFLFIFLYAVRVRWRNLPHGVLTGLFFVLYAIGRITVENYREPDSELIMGITKGQFYSVFMIFIGAAFLAWGWISRRKGATPSIAK